jgi:drug/metabolite transporter (DMT)-like permease
MNRGDGHSSDSAEHFSRGMHLRSPALKACAMLLLASFFWGMSFVTMKALGLKQEQMVPEPGTFFWTGLSLAMRFGVAALVLLVWIGRDARTTTRLERSQGLGLGLFGGLGVLFQMDGVQHTSASTSAFLTQCYCIFIPIYVALRLRRWPTKTVGVSVAMVLAGVAVLAQFDWDDLSLGRGEWETIIASLFFTGQILWLDRPVFRQNRARHVTLVMFGVMTLAVLPAILPELENLPRALGTFQSPLALGFMVVLTLFCTLAAYYLMNRWQRHVSATRAALIYCSEPVFASFFALFLPQWFSGLAGIWYANEFLTWELFVGGTLITLANVLIIRQAAREE